MAEETSVDPESSTGETSDCPGGAPTVGEAPYVLRTLLAEFDVADLDLGDIDNDGHLDLVSVSRAETSVETFFGDGSGNLESAGQTMLRESGFPDTIRLAAIADDTLDLIVHMEGPVEIWAVRGDGAGNWPTSHVYAGSYIRDLDLADFNGDGALDLAYDGASDVEVRLGVPTDESFSDATHYDLDYGYHLQAADIDGNGLVDIVTPAGFESAELQILSGIGDGSFEARTSIIASSAITGIDVGHVDDDGFSDLVLTTEDDLRIYYGREIGGVGSTPGTIVENALANVLLVDIDADGIQDIVTRTYYTNLEVRFSGGDRTFSSALPFECSGTYINSLRAGDLNEDCVADLVAATDSDICILMSERD